MIRKFFSPTISPLSIPSTIHFEEGVPDKISDDKTKSISKHKDIVNDDALEKLSGQMYEVSNKIWIREQCCSRILKRNTILGS